MDLVEIFTGDFFESEAVTQILEEDGIRCIVENRLMATIAPWYITPGGNHPVTIQISSNNYERAKELIAEFRKSL